MHVAEPDPLALQRRVALSSLTLILPLFVVTPLLLVHDEKLPVAVTTTVPSALGTATTLAEAPIA